SAPDGSSPRRSGAGARASKIGRVAWGDLDGTDESPGTSAAQEGALALARVRHARRAFRLDGRIASRLLPGAADGPPGLVPALQDRAGPDGEVRVGPAHGPGGRDGGLDLDAAGAPVFFRRSRSGVLQPRTVVASARRRAGAEPRRSCARRRDAGDRRVRRLLE